MHADRQLPMLVLVESVVALHLVNVFKILILLQSSGRVEIHGHLDPGELNSSQCLQQSLLEILLRMKSLPPSVPLLTILHSQVFNTPKFVLVIGATGAQGLAVIDVLLISNANGSASPCVVRALTRDPAGQPALEACFLGTPLFFPSFIFRLQMLIRGPGGSWDSVYGVRVTNVDGPTVGELETLRFLKTMQLAGFKLQYRAGHMNGKGLVADWLCVNTQEIWDATDTYNALKVTSVRQRRDHVRTMKFCFIQPWQGQRLHMGASRHRNVPAKEARSSSTTA
ncbi:hypothetical protein B0H12DRAFT_1066499 [Mycena haematopus]|nr:hypothetical protein B0H12DRAFT_1066499 [Mycena haematopus]